MKEWLIWVMDTLGYGGIALLMFLENVVPPIPSEIVMPAAGFTARNGELNFWLALLAGIAGSFVGALFWYYVGRWVGRERLKQFIDGRFRWIGLDARDIDKAVGWFDRWGGWTVLVCRLVPGVRTFISVPAGFAEMPVLVFSLYTLVGTTLWTFLLAGAGWYLRDQYARVENYIQPISLVVIATLLAWLVVYLYRRRRGWTPETAAR